MAHKILGIDLGAYSVKVAVLDAGFKRIRLAGCHERRLDPPPPRVAGELPEPFAQRATRALGELLADAGIAPEMAFVAVPGDRCVLRLLSFPFVDAKQIAQTISYEFEGQVPYEIADLVFDHEIIVAAEGLAEPVAIDEMPSNEPAAGSRVLCAGARREVVAELLTTLATAGVDPRGVAVAPLVYPTIARDPGREEGAIRLLVDVGHARTNLVALRDDRSIFARTVSHGGLNVTRAIARALRLSEPEAEVLKHTAIDLATVPSTARLAHDTRREVSEAARVESLVLVRDLRQTMAALFAAYGAHPAELLLCGGGAALAGLPEILQRELEIPVRRHDPQIDPEIDPTGRAASEGGLFSQALGLALTGAPGHLPIDLRKGELATRSDYSFLRAKAVHIATCLLAVLAFMAVDAFAALRELRREQGILDQRYARVSTEVFPGRKLSPEQIVALAQSGGKPHATAQSTDPGLPQQSAAVILEEISKAVPAADKLKLDVTQISIQPRSISLKGTTDLAANVDTLTSALKGAIACIDTINSGTITDAPSGGKEFELTIAHHCE